MKTENKGERTKTRVKEESSNNRNFNKERKKKMFGKKICSF